MYQVFYLVVEPPVETQTSEGWDLKIPQINKFEIEHSNSEILLPSIQIPQPAISFQVTLQVIKACLRN